MAERLAPAEIGGPVSESFGSRAARAGNPNGGLVHPPDYCGGVRCRAFRFFVKFAEAWRAMSRSYRRWTVSSWGSVRGSGITQTVSTDG